MTGQLPEIEVDGISIPKNGEGSVKAIVDVRLSGHYVAKGFRVVESKNGLFVAMPGVREKGGRFSDKFFPITKQAREAIWQKILEAYRNRENLDSLVKNSTKEVAAR